jgi:hypothetical protein
MGLPEIPEGSIFGLSEEFGASEYGGGDFGVWCSASPAKDSRASLSLCRRAVIEKSKASLLDLELHFNDLKLHSSGTIEDVAYKWGFLKDGASGGKDQPNLFMIAKISRVQCSARRVCELLWNKRDAINLACNETMKESRVLEELSDCVRIGYRRAGFGPMDTRDFVTLETMASEGPTHVMSMHSVESDLCPKRSEEGIVRGEIHIGGVIVRELGPKVCSMVFVTNVDLKFSNMQAKLFRWLVAMTTTVQYAYAIELSLVRSLAEGTAAISLELSEERIRAKAQEGLRGRRKRKTSSPPGVVARNVVPPGHHMQPRPEMIRV